MNEVLKLMPSTAAGRAEGSFLFESVLGWDASI